MRILGVSSASRVTVIAVVSRVFPENASLLNFPNSPTGTLKDTF
jgi:hypothetical protein